MSTAIAGPEVAAVLSSVSAMDADDKSTVVRPVRIARGRNPGEVACLEVVVGRAKGRKLVLLTGSTLIGRTSGAELVLDDDGVSRRHAKLVIGDEGVVNIIDLDSTNGTFLNGARVDMAVVREGDRIQIGPDVTLRFGHWPAQAVAPDDGVADDPVTRAAAAGLSKRELEVALLVAEGLTTEEIGAKLFISPRTVSTHLTRIYERLGLPSRSALARYVVERGLVRAR
ncbi:MAG: LuxR C-terminal-related transcriptional regulator [Nannocystaceae bacterium]|nr:LuxR C-terminal-related transcriptional regulator [Nannocystaceae bacterium]